MRLLITANVSDRSNDDLIIADSTLLTLVLLQDIEDSVRGRGKR